MYSGAGKEKIQSFQMQRKTQLLCWIEIHSADTNVSLNGQLEYFISLFYKEEKKILFTFLLLQVCVQHVCFPLYSPCLHLIAVFICRKMWTRSSICFLQYLMRMRVYSWMIILECLQPHPIKWIRRIQTFRNLTRCTVSTSSFSINTITNPSSYFSTA